MAIPAQRCAALPVSYAMESPDRVPKERYFDPDFYALEVERLWPRARKSRILPSASCATARGATAKATRPQIRQRSKLRWLYEQPSGIGDVEFVKESRPKGTGRLAFRYVRGPVPLALANCSQTRSAQSQRSPSSTLAT
jgi:hypothetical protein